MCVPCITVAWRASWCGGSEQAELDAVLARTSKSALIEHLESLPPPRPPLPVLAFNPGLEVERGCHIQLCKRVYRLSPDPTTPVRTTCVCCLPWRSHMSARCGVTSVQHGPTVLTLEKPYPRNTRQGVTAYVGHVADPRNSSEVRRCRSAAAMSMIDTCVCALAWRLHH
jgi:hypothetical protein